MHQSYLSLLGMAAFTNAIGPDLLEMLGGLPGAGKHSQAATQEAPALTTAAPKHSTSSEAYHVEEKSDVVDDYTHIYISSGTEVVEMATTTLYYPLTFADAASATSLAATISSQAVADATASSSLLIATPTLPAVETPAAANPLGSVPVLGGLGGGLPLKRDSSSAAGVGSGEEHEKDDDSSSATGASGESEHEWAPKEEPKKQEDEEEFPVAKKPEATTFKTFIRSSTSSSLAIPVGTPAASNPLGSLPVLGGLGGLKKRQLPVNEAEELLQLNNVGTLEDLKERQVPDAAEISQLPASRLAAATQSAGNEIASATQSADNDMASATKKAKSAAASATKAASPLQGLPVLGGLGGLGGI